MAGRGSTSFLNPIPALQVLVVGQGAPRELVAMAVLALCSNGCFEALCWLLQAAWRGLGALSQKVLQGAGKER